MKRVANDDAEDRPSKRRIYQIPPPDLGEVTSEDDLNYKTLKIQNQRLATRLQQMHAEQDELNSRITELEKRRLTEDSTLCTINSFWNQLDDDMQLLLLRCDPSEYSESEPRDATRSFLQVLEYDETSSSLEEGLENRCAFSKGLISKLLLRMDKLTQRQAILTRLLEERSHDVSKFSEQLEDALRAEILELATRNENLENLITSLHEKDHRMNLKLSKFIDKAKLLESELAEANTNLDDTRYNFNKEKHKTEKLNRHLLAVDKAAKDAAASASNSSFVAASAESTETTVHGDAAEGGQAAVSSSGPVENTQVVPMNQFEEVLTELNEYRDLASNRLNELEKMQRDVETTKRELEKLRHEHTTTPEEMIFKSVHYLSLQSRLSVSESEVMQFRSQNEDLRRLINQCKSQHESCLEHLESEQANLYNDIRAEVVKLKAALVKITHEYDELEMKYQQMTAINQQAESRLRELENFVKTSKDRKKQLTEELARMKEKQREIDSQNTNRRIGEKDGKGARNEAANSSSDDQTIKDLRSQLRKAQESQREMKILLDVYKSNVKDKRDKIEMLASEHRLKEEIEKYKEQLSKKEQEISNAEKMAQEKMKPHIVESENSVKYLQKKLLAAKQEQEALLTEMEMTGQAFEDMQEQNGKLLEQIKEKDDMNFKLMTESIKGSQMKKAFLKDKALLEEKISLLNEELENQRILCRKFEENEKLLQSTVAVKDQELQLRTQSLDGCERNLNELRQTVIAHKMELDNLRSVYQKMQNSLDAKVSEFEKDSYKLRRVQEERNSLKRKLDRLKKVDSMTSADEVLSEEVRMYKAKLTCPCCNVKKKDTVLTKCFHVFCSDCIKTRYETRQRKCPKCNAAFGANDYHRLYI